MTTKEYYIAPPDEIFDDIKENAIKLWETYDNSYGYVNEKKGRIVSIKNVQDNAWYIVAMFDHPNQEKLLKMVKSETAEMIKDARGY